MKRSSAAVLDDLLRRYPALAACEADIRAAGEMLIGAFRSGGKLLVCGNGGSCADGQHLVGELMKAFILPRKLNAEESGLLTALDPEYGGYMAEKLQGALPAISLSGETALMTATTVVTARKTRYTAVLSLWRRISSKSTIPLSLCFFNMPYLPKKKEAKSSSLRMMLFASVLLMILL